MTASFWYETNWNGPVPIGSLSTISGVLAAIILSAYSAERMEAKSIAMSAMKGASGFFSTNFTDIASSFSTWSTMSFMPMSSK